MGKDRTSVRALLAFGLALIALVLWIIGLGGPAQAAPGTGTDPAIRFITLNADLPLYDPADGDGVTKTVYFSNAVGGVLTLTVEMTGTPPLTFTAGAAFGEAERTYTSGTSPNLPWTVKVSYTISTGHSSQENVPFVVTNTDEIPVTVAITFVRDITGPTVAISSLPTGYFTGTKLVVTGTAADNEGGAGVQRVRVATDTSWVQADGISPWVYTVSFGTEDGTVYTVSATAEDFLGTAGLVATRSVTVDNRPPANPSVVTTTDGTPLGTWIPRNSVPISWSAVSDGSGVAYFYRWDSAPGTPVGDGDPYTTTQVVTASFSSGDNWFHLRAKDGAGNWATDTVHLGPFKVDTALPTVTVLYPAAGSVLTTSHQPQIVITGTAGDEHSGVEVVSVTTGAGWFPAIGTAAWAYTWTLPTADNKLYTVTAQAQDIAGNVSAPASVTVRVDTVTPTASAPQPHRAPWVTSTVVYTWPASTDGAGIAGYWVNITSTGGFTDTLWASGTSLTVNGVSEGQGYFARVRAVDGNGNRGNWSGLSPVVTPDLSAPTISNAYASGLSDYFYISGLTLFYTNTSGSPKTFYVGGNAADGGPSGLDRATFSSAFGSAPNDDTTPAAFSGSYDVPPGATESGQITVTVYDKAGNRATQVYTYTYDGLPPATGGITIAGGAYYVSRTNVSLSLFAADNVTGCGVAQMCLSNGPACSSWQSYSITASWTLDDSDGERTVYAWFRDNLANAAGPFTDTVFLDRVTPAGSITVAGGSLYTVGITVTLTLTADDPPPASGVARMRLSNDGTSWSGWEDFTSTRLWTLDGASDGLKTVYVQFQDRAGNVGGPFSDTILLDRRGPTVTIVSPSAGQVLTGVHQPTFVITGTAGDEHSGVEVVSVTTGAEWFPAIGTAAWTYTWTLPTADNKLYTVMAQAQDIAGNVSAPVSVTVRVDTVTPTASAPQPHRAPWVTSTVVYTWPASTDGAGIAGYWVNVTSTQGYTGVFWTAQAVLTFTQATVEGVGYRARVRAVDGNGNRGNWSGLSSVVTPDLSAPTVVVTAPAQLAVGPIPVSWSAADTLSGLEGGYTVLYKEDTGSWQVWLPYTTLTQADFVTVTLGRVYTFRTIAYDRAGNAGEGTATTAYRSFHIYLPLVLRNYPPAWSRGSGTSGQFRSPAYCKSNVWYAGTWDNGVWKSTDNAQNWSQVIQESRNPLPVVPNPVDCNQGFVRVWNDGVYKITGNTATAINNGLGELQVYGLVLSGTTLYAGTNTKGVYKTGINNISWQEANTGITEKRIRSLFVFGSEIYAGARDCKLYISSNGGQSWLEQTVLMTGCGDAQVWSIARAENTLYAGLGLNKGLYARVGGENWSKVTSIPDRTIYGLAHDADNRVLYVSTYGAGVYRCPLDGQGMVTGCTPHNIGLSTLNTCELGIGGGRLVVGSDDGIWYLPLFR